MIRLPDYVCLRRGTSSIWLARELANDATAELLADPDRLFSLPGCTVIKDQRKIKVGRVELEINGFIRQIYMKRYNSFSWRYRLGSLLIPSGAVRSLEGALTLIQGGFFTGKPLAAVECRSYGVVSKSFYLSEEIKGSKTADAYWREVLSPLEGEEGFRRRRIFLGGLARLFCSLHQRNIYHNDLKDANILVRYHPTEATEMYYLLDLEGIRRYRTLSRGRRIKNLVQLNRTMGRFLRPSERLYWLSRYLGSVFLERRERRQWVGEILSESDRRTKRSLRKR